MGQVYNANTPENHPIIFRTETDFKNAMSILAVCAKVYSCIHVYAFQLMSNHIHLVVGGDKDLIIEFFSFFVSRLDKYFECKVDFRELKLKLFPIPDLTYFRNAVAYVNRNGFVVNNDVTPFSYQWGSGMFVFQPMLFRLAEQAAEPMGITAVRELMHSRKCDFAKDLRLIDGYILPTEFCDIKTAEMLFRDAKQYFYSISRKVESYSEVARSIGEALFYTDQDLYNAALQLSKSHYETHEFRTLPVTSKLELAKRLHYDYNASEKQLQRLLKIDASLLRAMF